MAVLQKILDVLPLNEEKRRFQRVRVNLLGRYMLADRREFPCQVLDMSPGGMAIIGPVSGIAGERVVAYIDHVGRLEGTIIRVLPNGFAMSIAATPRKRDKLAAQLTWLANRQILGLPEDRRHDRIVPRNPRSTMVLADGTAMVCRIIDMSLSGAAVSATRNRTSVRSLRWARPRAGWSVTSKTALRSSLPACSTRTFSKRTSPVRKRRRVLRRRFIGVSSRASRHLRRSPLTPPTLRVARLR